MFLALKSKKGGKRLDPIAFLLKIEKFRKKEGK
jgi:hypothetical protein